MCVTGQHMAHPACSEILKKGVSARRETQERERENITDRPWPM